MLYALCLRGQTGGGYSDRAGSDSSQIELFISRPELQHVSPSEWEKEYGKFLVQHPDNLLARYYLAGLRVQMGHVQDADADIQILDKAGFPVSTLVQLRAQLADVVGRPQDQIAAYEKFSRPLPANDPVVRDPSMVEAWKINSRVASIRVLELNGKIDLADEAWHKFLKEDSNEIYYLGEYGDFRLRQGDFAGAIVAYQARLDSMPKNQPSVDVTAAAKLQFAEALWANGKLEDAQRQASSAMKLLLQNRETSRHSSSFLPRSVFFTLVLAQREVGSADDRAMATAALRELTATFNSDTYFEDDALLALLAGKWPKEKASAELASTLKDAPNLQWALWAQVYLGLGSPEAARTAVRAMHEPSVQRTILSSTFPAL
jgi:predicted Zn-dependent protease